MTYGTRRPRPGFSSKRRAAAPVPRSPETGDLAAWRASYSRGWAHGSRSGTLIGAPELSAPFVAGFLDHSTGRTRWHSLYCVRDNHDHCKTVKDSEE